MSAAVLRFKRPNVPGGIVYVVPACCDEVPDDTSWLLYSQAFGAAEPDLQRVLLDIDTAVKAGRQLATSRSAQFVVDFGGGHTGGAA